MAYTPLKISIPEPCHEDWNGMHPVPGTTARHCDSCAKSVVDFTGFSDVQMHAYVREQGGKLCGRFRPDQLGRPLRAVSTPTSNPLKVAAAAAAVLLAATSCDATKEVTGSSLINEARQQPVESVATPLSVGQISLEQTKSHLTASPTPEVKMAVVGGFTIPPPPPLAGKISAEFMPPPPAYDDTEMLRGKPVIEIFDEETVEGEIMIEDMDDASFVTCGTKDIVPPEADEDFLMGDIDFGEEDIPPVLLIEQDTIPIPEEVLTANDIRNLPTRHIESVEAVVMGIVAMEHPRPTGIDWVKDTLKNVLPSFPTLPSQDPSLHQRPRPEMPHLEAVSVYPNPFIDHLKIDIDLPSEEILTVELLDPTGRLVFSKLWKAVAGANTLTIEPKQRKLKHAIYHLRITDEREFSVVKTVLK